MDSLYTDLSEYYVFDKQKYTLEEFFTDLKTFKDSFIVSISDSNSQKFENLSLGGEKRQRPRKRTN